MVAERRRVDGAFGEGCWTKGVPALSRRARRLASPSRAARRGGRKNSDRGTEAAAEREEEGITAEELEASVVRAPPISSSAPECRCFG